MMLIGMFDSPFVRRVATTLKLYVMPFEHADWSVGRDFERIREFSPLGRVPALVMDDGEVLVESFAILDYLDDHVGPTRALVPASGASRRAVLQLMAQSIAAAEKGRDMVYEQVMRPAGKRHEPWIERCRSQMHGALGQVEIACQRSGIGRWLVDDAFSQADITATCVFTFLCEALGVSSEAALYPALTALVARCEMLPEFQATHVPWFRPTIAVS